MAFGSIPAAHILVISMKQNHAPGKPEGPGKYIASRRVRSNVVFATLGYVRFCFVG